MVKPVRSAVASVAMRGTARLLSAGSRGTRIMSESDDFTKLDDQEFLAARRIVHDALGRGESPDLATLYQAMNEEFCRRARIEWRGEE